MNMSADADSGAGTSSPDNLRQEIRLAVVMTGGVSLAIWMGGVARELNLLLHSGNNASALARRVQGCYQSLRELLSVDVSVDVLSGTSAGGINAAILGLANVNNSDIGALRDLWLEKGDFGVLLRDPDASPTPSLLQGDEQLLAGLRSAMETIAGPGQSVAASPPPTDVFITTTFLDGEPSRFVDDYNTLVSDVEHHGLFHFGTDQLASQGAGDQLALAGRCTASFPVAFEPSHLTIGPDAADATHPDMTGLSNATRTCYVADGGLLANRPIAAAVRAVFDRTADTDVRRILLYIVPTAAPTSSPTTPRCPCSAAPSSKIFPP
jgi:patatin-related protein